jgi:outer membrane biosynthesis protein TonB
MAELFADFDLERRAPRAQPMLRTLAGSIILHAVFVLCLIYVPAVRDTFQVASALRGLRVVDEDYNATQVGERATVINLADNKLYYPPGYFELANGQQVAPAPTPPPDVQLVAAYKPPKPTPTPTPVPTPTPAPSASSEIAQHDQTGAPGAAPNASPSASPAGSPSPADLKSAEDAEKALQEAKQEKFPPINSRPFTDLLQKGKEMKDAGEIDLNGTLELTVEGDRRDDGTLTNVEITGGSASDAKLKDLAKAFIAALSDSHALAALKDTSHLRMNLLLDGEKIAVRVVTEVETPAQAQQMANGYRGLILIGALSKKGKDEEAIFKNLSVSANERQIVLGFTMPRKDASALISKLTKKLNPARAASAARVRGA